MLDPPSSSSSAPLDPPPISSSTKFPSTSTASTPQPPPIPSTSTSISYSYPPAPPYPPLTPLHHTSPICLLSTPSKGRGVFSTSSLPAGYLIDTSPVLLISKEEYYGMNYGGKEGEGKGVEGSVLRGYVFTWKGKEGGMALALGLGEHSLSLFCTTFKLEEGGGVSEREGEHTLIQLTRTTGSLFNHSSTPNVTFELDPTNYTIRYKIFTSIPANTELCIFYGHKTSFSPPSTPTLTSSDLDEEEKEGIEGPWANFDGIISERLLEEKRRKKEKEKWGEDIVMFEELNWRKVTGLVDPEDQELVTYDCWAITIPARHSKLAFAFVRAHSQKIDELNHLKRVKRVLPPSSLPPTGDDPHSILLFPLSTSPPNLPSLISSSPLGELSPIPEPYIVPVPSAIARTEKQGEEWGNVWPVQMVHIREGPKALPRAKGWERCKRDWVMREAKRAVKAGKEAGERGEHPIACHVTESFNPNVHSPTRLPTTIVKAHDTRLSTRNILCHAATNAIDAVAHLDVHGLRTAPLSSTSASAWQSSSSPSASPSRTPSSATATATAAIPYLLTSLTIFTTHEPCLLCSMSLLHSRISTLFYIKRAKGSGGCGSEFSVHEDGGLNHRFEVWEWRGGEEGGVEVGEVEVDP